MLKDKNEKPIPIKRNHFRGYLNVKARCSSELSHCEEIDENDHTIQDTSNVFFNHKGKHGASHWYSYKKEGNQPETDLTGIINQNKRKGVKHRYAVKTRIVNTVPNSSDDVHNHTFSLRKMCHTKYNKKTKTYQITDDCECFVAREFSSTDYLIALADPKKTYGYLMSCAKFDDDSESLSKDYGWKVMPDK